MIRLTDCYNDMKSAKTVEVSQIFTPSEKQELLEALKDLDQCKVIVGTNVDLLSGIIKSLREDAYSRETLFTNSDDGKILLRNELLALVDKQMADQLMYKGPFIEDLWERLFPSILKSAQEIAQGIAKNALQDVDFSIERFCKASIGGKIIVWKFMRIALVHFSESNLKDSKIRGGIEKYLHKSNELMILEEIALIGGLKAAYVDPDDDNLMEAAQTLHRSARSELQELKIRLFD